MGRLQTVAVENGQKVLKTFISTGPADITIPIGAVVPYAGSSTPAHFLLCDGTEYQAEDYPELYDVIGNTYGGVSGTSFCVPDYRELALRGVGQNTTHSAIATHDVYTLGEMKDSALANHGHSAGNARGLRAGSDWTGYQYGDVSGTPTGITRGKSIGVNFIIRCN